MLPISPFAQGVSAPRKDDWDATPLSSQVFIVKLWLHVLDKHLNLTRTDIAGPAEDRQ